MVIMGKSKKDPPSGPFPVSALTSANTHARPTAQSSKPGIQGSSGVDIEAKIGGNTNKKGKQQVGSIEAFNTESRSTPIAVPRNGKFSLSISDKKNYGDEQVVGGIRIGIVVPHKK